MLKLGMLVVYGTLINSEIEKAKLYLHQDMKWRGEFYAIDFYIVRYGCSVWGVNKGWDQKT